MFRSPGTASPCSCHGCRISGQFTQASTTGKTRNLGQTSFVFHTMGLSFFWIVQLLTDLEACLTHNGETEA